jgi:hypothetical protein
MSSFGTNRPNNGQIQAPQQTPAKADQPNKVKFSSIKLSTTKQGSPTVGLYLKREELEKLVALGSELLAMPGNDGCKIGVIVIAGQDYDSGYCYVNPKEPKQEGGGNQRGNYQNRSSGGYQGGQGYRKQASNFGDKSSARAYMQSKRVDDGKAD